MKTGEILFCISVPPQPFYLYYGKPSDRRNWGCHTNEIKTGAGWFQDILEGKTPRQTISLEPPPPLVFSGQCFDEDGDFWARWFEIEVGCSIRTDKISFHKIRCMAGEGSSGVDDTRTRFLSPFGHEKVEPGGRQIDDIKKVDDL